MKSTVTRLDPPKPAFVPVKVEIICETEKELATLYQLGNWGADVAKVVKPDSTSRGGLNAPLTGAAADDFLTRAFFGPIRSLYSK